MTRTAARARKGDTGNAAKQSPAGSSGRSRFSDEEDAARTVTTKFDPHKDYYKILGLDRAASWREVKAAYKRLALSLHPDKERSATPDQAAAVARKFLEVAEAHDHLTDEDQRAAYDKVRDYMEAHPGMDVPTLCREQAAMMQKGLSELVQMRRKGLKAQKHYTSMVPLPISLEKLNSGCIRTVSRDRSRVDGRGLPSKDSKTFHVVISKGSQPGQKHIMEGEGDETADIAAGDLVFVLQQKPHAKLRRAGMKNLEYVAKSSMQKGHILFGESVCGIYDRSFLVTANLFLEAAANGGKGCTYCHVLTGEGLYDPADPWGQPKGDMVVKVRVPPLPQRWTLQYSPKPVHLVRSSQDTITGAVVGAHMGSLLSHSLTAVDMLSDWSKPSTACPGGVCLCIHDAQRHTWGQCTERKTSDQNQLQARADHCEAGSSKACHSRQQAGNHQADITSRVSPAAAAMMQTCSLTASGSGLQWSVIDLRLDSHLNHSACAATGSSPRNTQRRQGDCNISGEVQPSSAADGTYWNQQMQGGLYEVPLDDEWKALEEAQVVVLDLAEELQQSQQWLSLGFSGVSGNSTSRSSCKQALIFASKSQV
ncbi:TPA: DnaJ subfamily C member 10 [Trebouxia sp. C0004]